MRCGRLFSFAPETPVLLVCIIIAVACPAIAQVLSPHNHVVVVAFENHSYEAKWDGVIDDTISAGMPYLNSILVPTYSLATNFYANNHDSLKQYFELTAGTEFCLPYGAGSGSISCGGNPVDYNATTENIFHMVQQAGMSWKQYAECMPNSDYGIPRGTIKETSPVTGCGISGNYAPRHIPAIYYAAVRQATAPSSDVDCTAVATPGYVSTLSLQGCNVVQFENATWGFAADVAAQRLPNFSFITPSMQNDTHSGSKIQADAWIQTNLGPLLSSCYFTGNGCTADGLLILWWDEGAVNDSAYTGRCASWGYDDRANGSGICGGGGRVAIVLAAKDVVRTGYKSATYYNHPALTRAILEALDLSANGFPAAVKSANTMANFFKRLLGHIDDRSFTCTAPCSGYWVHDTSSGNQLDGQSLQLDFTGGNPYSAALFDSSSSLNVAPMTDFDLDFWVKVSSSSAPQALEFSVIQVVNGLEYPFQHQCDFKATKTWRVWNPGSSSWIGTGVGCAPFVGAWNHFTLHFTRTSSNQLWYKDIEVNGTTYLWNTGLLFAAVPSSNSNSVTFRIRLAGDSTPTTYTIWTDKMNLN